MSEGVEDFSGLGPKMMELPPIQRKFVLAMAADPFGTAAEWARTAGYSDTSGGAKVAGHRLLHDPRVQVAVEEFAKQHFQTVGPMIATAGMLRIARMPDHPKHLRALEMVANRVGLPEVTEHTVNVNHSDRTGAAMVERIKEMARLLNVNPEQLLGVNAEPKLIEGEVVDER